MKKKMLKNLVGGRKSGVWEKRSISHKSNPEKQGLKIRKSILEKIIEEARATPSSLVGVDVKGYNLSREEKKYLVGKGLFLNIVRRRDRKTGKNFDALVLIYPSGLRARDLREKIRKKKGGEKV